MKVKVVKMRWRPGRAALGELTALLKLHRQTYGEKGRDDGNGGRKEKGWEK